MDSTRTSVIKPRLFSMRSRKSAWNVCLHSRHNHLCDALGTHRGISVLEFRIEIVGGNRVEVAVSSHRILCFGEEEKMRFSGGEMVFHRMKIRTEATNVAEMNEEEIRGVVIPREIREVHLQVIPPI